MQDIFLTLGQRISLWNLTGAHQVTSLREASVFLRLIEKLRLTDEEARDIQFFNDGRQYQWTTPSPGYGNRTVELEDSEALALASVIEGMERIRVVDASWLQPLLDQCNAAKPQQPVAA